ncbi:hypothetical protein [Micromonospora sp. KC207]|uniref:hypothetical protein n=1 Tax=Micromonospora sp. KC207 TaxID=2530377 RepID=UPI001A9F06F4|nr:hypothetical protein [Micromonospora sp. KC207]
METARGATRKKCLCVDRCGRGTAEVRGAELEHQLAAAPVVRGQAALAGVVQAAGQGGPRLSAATALPDSEPRLIPEMLTTDSGRNTRARPRAAPSTFAHGSRTSCPAVAAADGGTARPNVRCLMIGYPAVCSMSLSVPNPK